MANLTYGLTNENTFEYISGRSPQLTHLVFYRTDRGRYGMVLAEGIEGVVPDGAKMLMSFYLNRTNGNPADCCPNCNNDITSLIENFRLGGRVCTLCDHVWVAQ